MYAMIDSASTVTPPPGAAAWNWSPNVTEDQNQEKNTETKKTAEPSALDEEVRRKEFGKYVRKHRGFSMTQGALGKEVKHTQSYISDVENGVRLPTREEIPAYAKALNRSVKEVMKAAGYDPDPEVSDEIILSKGQRIRIIAREGEEGTALDVDETTLAILEALAAKVTRKKPS